MEEARREEGEKKGRKRKKEREQRIEFYAN